MPKDPQENLERIAQLLEKIENHLAPPPLWKRGTSFLFQHAIVIVSLVSLLAVTLKIWGSVEGISDTVSNILPALQGKVDLLKGLWK